MPSLSPRKRLTNIVIMVVLGTSVVLQLEFLQPEYLDGLARIQSYAKSMLRHCDPGQTGKRR